jgi:GT2 family glycosyltransferase
VSGRVVAVVVHWQDLEDTRACVASAAAEPGVDVVVVDNASREPVGSALGRARVLRTAENRGYAGGANVGIRAALDAGADTVLLLNNDVRLRPGATRAALAALAADPRIGVVGAKVLSREDPSRLWLAWGELTYRQSLVALRGAGVPDGPAFAEQRDVPWVAGCAMWLRAAALADVGLFDEEFFAYHEEVDWCTRARRSAWRVVYVPSVVVSHTGRGSAGGRQAVRVRKYFAARNSILFARKHATPWQRAKLAGFLLATLPLQLLRHLPRGTVDEVRLKMRGVRDALTGRPPPLDALGLRFPRSPTRDGSNSGGEREASPP